MDKDQIVGDDGTVYTVAQLRAAFQRHQNPKNWKLLFVAIVASRAEALELSTAIMFYLADDASVETFVEAGGKTLW